MGLIHSLKGRPSKAVRLHEEAIIQSIPCAAEKVQYLSSPPLFLSFF